MRKNGKLARRREEALTKCRGRFFSSRVGHLGPGKILQYSALSGFDPIKRRQDILIKKDVPDTYNRQLIFIQYSKQTEIVKSSIN